jgi:aspartate racemase
MGHLLSETARKLEQAGADFILIATNTMHKLAPMVEAALSVPLLHIVDATAEAIIKAGFTRVGLLGTRFTMEEDFYRQRLIEKYKINVLIPTPDQRDLIHQVIFRELVMGEIKEKSRLNFIRIINDLKTAGAQGIILGCTEIPLLIKPEHSPLPLFDTIAIHARRAVEWALQDESS